jgi:hypothetical protein
MAVLMGAMLMNAAEVTRGQDRSIPRPEHPRPDMRRAEWLNLNGPWDFAETDDDGDESFLAAARYPATIMVPFCRESRLSGLERRGFVRNVWYRRRFTVPEEWRTDRVRLHVGACDWASRVWVNGVFMGEHIGGNSPFVYDVTGALRDGENTVIVHARDDTRSGKQPLGKQSTREESHGIFYTRTTGIWQTVWLEGVNASHIASLRVTPHASTGQVTVEAQIDGPTSDLEFNIQALASGQVFGEASVGVEGRSVRLDMVLSERHLWRPSDPYLYDLVVTLKRDAAELDRLDSYFGLRDVTIEGAAILINGEPIFQRLVLDQGFYPDGVWTAPTDYDLRSDITMSQEVGFNGARLHQKVFEPRFLYWADKLGYLVWGEYPSFGANYGDSAVNLPIIDEWVQLVERDRNHPSIIGWCPFNETPPAAGPLQNAVVPMTRDLDPTRPILDTSGWHHSLADPLLSDAHDYDQDPESFRNRWVMFFGDVPLPLRYRRGIAGRPFFVSEYGGIGWDIGKGWGYGQTPESMEAFYERFAGLTGALLDNPHMFALCYTQLTDVEQEKNGLYTFDRKPKFDAAKLRAAMARPAAYEQNPPLNQPDARDDYTVLVGAYPDGAAAKEWRYTVDKPAEDWASPSFDDESWKTGLAAFGAKTRWQGYIRTPWIEKDIWLRQAFEYDGAAFSRAVLAIHIDWSAEVFLNGEPVWSCASGNDHYAGHDLSDAVRRHLRPGRNTLAVHAHQQRGQHYIDCALLIAP